MRFRNRQEAIPLSVSAGERQAAGRAERLLDCALGPKPTAGDLIFTTTHVAVITDCVLIVFDGRDSVNGTTESSRRSCRCGAPTLARPRNRKLPAKDAALEVEDVDGNRINLCRS